MSTSVFSVSVDNNVIALAAAGEHSAMSSIYKQFAGQVYSLGLRICQDATEAEDVLQDTFVDVFRKLGQYRGDAPFWFWLRQIAVNTALLRIRQRRNWDVALELVSQETASSADPVVHLDLENVLAALPVISRTVLLLHEVEGYTHREIGRLMGKSESFSKSQLARAHERLRKHLKWDNSTKDSIRIQRN